MVYSVLRAVLVSVCWWVFIFVLRVLFLMKPLSVFLADVVSVLGGLKSRLPSLIVSRVSRGVEEEVDVYGRVSCLADVRDFVKCISGGGFSRSFACLDSSSRSIGFHGFRVFFAGLALLTPRGVSIRPSNVVDVEFMALKSFENILVEIEKSGLDVRVRSPIGEYYVEDYKDDNIGDELRLQIENIGLESIVGSGLSANIDFILVDGPVYPTPPIMFLKSFQGSKYVRAFEKLIRERLNILARRECLAVGFVKRCGFSRKLYRDPVVREFFTEKFGSPPGEIWDPVIVECIVEKYFAEYSSSYPILLLGPFKISYGLDYMPDKVFWYVYVRMPRGNYVYRFEVLKEDADKYGLDVVEETISKLLRSSSVNGVPLGIEIVDRLSKRLTAAIYKEMYFRSRGVLSLMYDESNKIIEVLRELGEV